MLSSLPTDECVSCFLGFNEQFYAKKSEMKICFARNLQTQTWAFYDNLDLLYAQQIQSKLRLELEAVYNASKFDQVFIRF